MTETTFDPAAFEEMVIDKENETKSTPVPEGVYEALIDTVRVKSVTLTKGDRAGEVVPILEVNYLILDEEGELAKELNRERITVRQDIWLDVQGSGAKARLSFGPNQNLALGRLREATGLNKPGITFGQMEGAGPISITVVLDPRENGDVYNRVVKTMKV